MEGHETQSDQVLVHLSNLLFLTRIFSTVHRSSSTVDSKDLPPPQQPYSSLSDFCLFSYFVVEFSVDVAMIIVLPAPERAILKPGVKSPLDDNPEVVSTSTRLFEELNAFVYAEHFIKELGRLSALVETMKFAVAKHDRLTSMLSLGSQPQQQSSKSNESSSSSSTTSCSSISASSSSSSIGANSAVDGLQQLEGQLEKSWKRVRWLNKIVKCIRQKSSVVPSSVLSGPFALSGSTSLSTSYWMVPLRPTKLVKRRPSLPPSSRLPKMDRLMSVSTPTTPTTSPKIPRRKEEEKEEEEEENVVKRVWVDPARRKYSESSIL